MKGIVTSVAENKGECLLTVGVSLPEFEFSKNWDELGPRERSELRHSEEYKKAIEEHDNLIRSILSSLSLGEIDFHYPKGVIGYSYTRYEE